MWTIISINWTAQALTDEQLLVLRNVAAQHMRQRKKAAVLHFSHELCEGEITRKNVATIGTFAGTMFHADLGTVRGERWTCDFMLPQGTENIVIGDNSIVVSSRPLSTGGVEASVFDHRKATINEPRATSPSFH